MSEPSAAPSTVGNEVGPQCPPLFGRPTPRAPRPTLGGILPLTNGRFVKEQTGPDLDERSLSFSMAPDRAIPTEKSIGLCSLAAVGRRPFSPGRTCSQPVAPGAPAGCTPALMPVLSLSLVGSGSQTSFPHRSAGNSARVLFSDR